MSNPMSGSERRRELRHKIRVKVVFFVEGEAGEHAAFTRDISTGGMFIESRRALEYGTRLRVLVTVPAIPVPVEAMGKVCWSVASEGFGVHFEGLRAIDTWALNQLFAASGKGA